MENAKLNSPDQKKKSSGFKTFLSVIFFIFTLGCALALAVNLSMQGKSSALIDAYSSELGSGFTSFLSGKLCFWCMISAVVLWFGLWLCTTKRIASAIRGLGLSCAIASALVLAGELITMLLVCAFKIDSILTPFADSLPSQFGDTAGKNVIMLLSSVLIASVGIFICKLQKLPKKKKDTATQNAPVPQTVPAAAETAENTAPVFQTVPAKPVANVSVENNSDESLVSSLAGVCHMCGNKNEPNVKFCGKCGAKLI